MGPLVEALAKVRTVTDRSVPALFRIEGDPDGPLNLTPRVLPIDAIEQLQRVRSGELEAADLLSVPERAPQIPIDPTSVKERFHRDNRGVQVLTKFMAEGGATSAFFDAVNQMIRDDKGVEPVLTGLVNTTVLLAMMTAGALGASPEGLIAGLLDTYSRIEDDVHETAAESSLSEEEPGAS